MMSSPTQDSKLTGLAALLLVACCLPERAIASAPLPSLTTTITTTIEPRRALIGDLLTLRVVAVHEPGHNLTLVDHQFGPFELRAGPSIEQRALGEDQQQTTFTFVLAAFTVGRLSVPPLQFTDAASGATRTLASQPVTVEVEPLTTEADTEIKGVVHFREPRVSGKVLPALLSTLALSALAYAGMRRVVRRLAGDRSVSGINMAGRQMPLESEAIDHIRKLMDAQVAARDDKQFHVELSVILRDYCVRRYGLPALAEQTHAELLGVMRRRAGEAVTERFGELLQICELAKFARYRFEEYSSYQTARVAIELIGEQAAKGSQI